MAPKTKSEFSGKDDGLLQAVIIADSFDCSFSPLSVSTPRCLFPLANRPLIDYALTVLKTSGVVHEVFVYCTAHAIQIREHVSSSWSSVRSSTAGPGFSVTVVANENCHSFGDAVRDLDAKGVLRQDFVLVSGDVVANVQLKDVMEKHRAICKSDPNASMTLVYKRCAPGHPCRTADREMVVATTGVGDGGQIQRIVFHERTNRKKVDMPLEIFEDHSSLSLRFDLLDPCIAICTQTVPPLFADNFDFQTLDDLVGGIIKDDLLDNTLYMYEVVERYAARVSDPMTYGAVSSDVLARWTFPIAPDLMRGDKDDGDYAYCRKNIYKGEGIKLEKGSTLVESVIVGHNSELGENSVVSKSCVGRKVRLGKNASVTNSILFDGVVLGDNAKVIGCLIGAGVTIKAGSVIREQCILGDGVVIEEGKVVPEGTRLVREAEDDEFGGGDQDTGGDKGSEFGPFAVLYVEDSGSDSGSEADEAGTDPKHDGWGRPLDDCDSESSSSEDSDISGLEEQMGDLLLNEDAKISVFHGEVLESLHRGAAEGINPENLVLEINSSRHAYAATPQLVVQSVTQSILTIAKDGGDEEVLAGAKLLRSVQKSIKEFKVLLAKYCTKTASAQNDCLVALEEHCASDANMETVAAKVLQVLYDEDLLAEEAIIKWHEAGEDESVETKFPGFGEKFRERVRPFVEWLQEDDDSEEEESD